MLQAEIAVLRFGLGARPGEIAAARVDPRGWLLAQTVEPAAMASNTPLTTSDRIFAATVQAREMQREARADAAPMAANLVREAYLPHYRAQVLARAQSAAATARPFTERLVHFWSNHFAVSADKGTVLGLAGTLENEAIRPHVNGRFVDLLIAAEQHPAMIAFLDNQNSVGPDSPFALAAARRDDHRHPGINENLAREILELHTLGVGGGYSQADVTSFAQIITGWSIGGVRSSAGEIGRFDFHDKLHQPGAKRFMNVTYPDSGVGQGVAVLRTLSRQPATAHFIARKLVRHFVADDPPPAAVERVARAFLATDGDLPQVYRALIDCPDAWSGTQRKFKTPEDFVFSALRSFSTAPRDPEPVVHSFAVLGQRQFTPGSPTGWPDAASSWDGSDALMHRISWAAQFAARAEHGVEPVELAADALGRFAREETLTSIRRAATAAQALTLLLMSPEFQRR